MALFFQCSHAAVFAKKSEIKDIEYSDYGRKIKGSAHMENGHAVWVDEPADHDLLDLEFMKTGKWIV